MRRICRIESFGPELKLDAFRDSELTEESQIQVRRARALQRVEAYGPEPGRVHRREGRRVIIRSSHPDAAELLDFGFDLIGALRAVRRIQGCTARRNAERIAREGPIEPAQLPAASQSSGKRITGQPTLPFAEGQLICARELEVVRDVDAEDGAVQVTEVRLLNRDPAVIISAESRQADGLRP